MSISRKLFSASDVGFLRRPHYLSLRRRQSTTPGIDSLRNRSQKLVLISRRFAAISVSSFDWLGFLRAL